MNNVQTCTTDNVQLIAACWIATTIGYYFREFLFSFKTRKTSTGKNKFIIYFLKKKTKQKLL